MPSTVTLLLKGLIVLSAKEGNTEGKVGILKTRPAGHKLTITVEKFPPTGPPPPKEKLPTVKDRLYLEITPTEPKITVRDKTPVKRLDTVEHPESIKWFVDLENNELYDSKIGVSSAGFESVLEFNSGELYTAVKPNESILQVLKKGSSEFQDFGKVALVLGIDFKAATRAVFRNGSKVVFDSNTEPNFNYRIQITNDAETHPPISGDANFYYTTLALDIPLTDKTLFLSTSLHKLLKARLEQEPDQEFRDLLSKVSDTLIEKGEPPVGPEAACFPAYVSKSDF